jgi:pSer/pThr/pTyr-binding forkhead associated (FHA) protein
VITLTLLHPSQSTPVQTWTFEKESLIRIGRSNNNDIIVYSSIVSRRHVELSKNRLGWEVVNLGANGTYVDNKLIVRASVLNVMIIRLGISGPKICIYPDGNNGDTQIKSVATRQTGQPKIFNPSKETETFITGARQKY